jgi:hypothetical protein
MAENQAPAMRVVVDSKKKEGLWDLFAYIIFKKSKKFLSKTVGSPICV